MAVTYIAEGRGRDVGRIQAHRPKCLLPVPVLSSADGFRVQVRMLNFLPKEKDLLALDAPMIYRK